MDASELLKGIPLMPVVAITNADNAVALGECLLNSGIKAIEVTLRTQTALESIEALAKKLPELLLGAGSVRTPAHFAAVRDAGAQFAVSPGATEALVAAADLPWLPGIATASESMRLLELGYRTQKFFPAEILGGVAALKALGAPLPEVQFCPTGGINEALAPSYLALDNVSCIGGSWFVPPSAIEAGDFRKIGGLIRSALAQIHD